MAFSFGKRERYVIENVLQHFKLIIEGTNTLKDFIESYFLEDKVSDELFLKIAGIEKKGDNIRRSVILDLHRGSFIPELREGFHSLVEKNDRTLNKIETVSKIISFQKPVIIPELRKDIIKQVDCLVRSAEALNKAVEFLFEDMDRVNEYILLVEKMEHEEDELEAEMIKKLFSTELPLERKMETKEVIVNIGDITDIIEDTSDILEVILLKMSL